MPDVIPEEVKQFLLKYITSIAQWEGLLMLRSDASKIWSIEELSRHIYTSDKETAQLVKQLMEHGIVVAESQTPLAYRYHPVSAEMERIISHAAEFYKRYLIPVTNIIHSKSRNRIQEFADAFKLGKD